jgi:uncharacterized membrane protein
MIKVLKATQTVLTVVAILCIIFSFVKSDNVERLLYRLNAGMSVVVSVLVIPKVIEDLEK